MRVLIIEDDPGVAKFLARSFREACFAVEVARDGNDGYRLATNEFFDFIVLDLMLPGMDGLSLLKEMRAQGVQTPVICLTARDAVRYRVQGLNRGADDYIVKPFSFSELLARIHAVLRRGEKIAAQRLRIGDLVIEPRTRTVIRAGQRIELTPREYSLLEYLSRNIGRIVTRTMLLENVWETKQDPLANVVDVHVNRLRKKVDHGFDKPLIRTVRGVGYALQEP